jgi:hypothetical protein
VTFTTSHNQFYTFRVSSEQVDKLSAVKQVPATYSEDYDVYLNQLMVDLFNEPKKEDNHG